MQKLHPPRPDVMTDTLKPSRFNIISGLKDNSNYVILNLLSGNADIISAEELKALEQPNNPATATFKKRGYLTDPEKEIISYRMAYMDFLEERDKEEVQLFFIPTYACNLNCSYCYQAPYLSGSSVPDEKVTGAFFDFSEQLFSGRRKYVTLFGGEPLLPGKRHREFLSAFTEQCAASNTDIALVTNGYHLDDYLELLSKASIREIQLTLDGPERIHNKRRPHKDGSETFSRISSALDRCLQMGLRVNLRMVVDRENLDYLPEFARYAIEKGWTASPYFKTQLGRNYELHHCHSEPGRIYSRISMYEELYHLIKKHPEILEFHKPAFSVSRFLKDKGTLPPPLFDACPACKSEWAFDYKGVIYPCTATVGKPGEELGRFFPELQLNEEKIRQWQYRDVRAINECRDCALQMACGGGCGAVALNSEGSILKPDCRPVKELTGLGISLYF